MTASERSAWLRERQSGLGGTDMAGICGVGFHAAAEVYAEKVSPEPVDRPPTDLMRMGLATEDYNASLYAQKTGAKLVSPGLIRATSEPWAFATFDRIRCGEPAVVEIRDTVDFNIDCPVECKYARFFDDAWGPDGSDQIKDGYTIQATWEALILRLSGHAVERTDVSALSGSGEHRVYPIPFDPQLGQMLLELGRAFWDRVETRSGAEGWQHPLVETITQKLETIRPGTTTALGFPALDIATEIDGLTLTKKAGEEAEERIRLLKKDLAAMLGGCEVGVLPDGRRVKLYPVTAKLITPAPYEGEARVDVRILRAPKGKKEGAL